MPLYNWIKCTGGELTYLRKNHEGNDLLDSEMWEIVYDSYIKEYGLSDQYKKMLEAMKQKALCEADFVITGNRFKLTEAEIAASKLETIVNNSGNGMTIEESLVHLSKWMGQWLNPKNITTKDYFNLLNEYGKANKSNRSI